MMKNLCTLDPRVKDQYVYDPDSRWKSVSAADIMREMHEFRVKMGHEPGSAYRPIHQHEYPVQPAQGKRSKRKMVRDE